VDSGPAIGQIFGVNLRRLNAVVREIGKNRQAKVKFFGSRRGILTGFEALGTLR
jgi:hypothetical protein